MAEVRPWLGSYVSVAQFTTLKELVLINCSVLHNAGAHYYFTEPDAATREKAVWADVDQAFSEPINPDDSTADYAPTQILAEAFRKHGYDGIVYKSLLGKGHNIALFNIKAADLINCSLYNVKAVSLKFGYAHDTYGETKYLAKKSPAARLGKTAPKPKSHRLIGRAKQPPVKRR